LKAFVKRLLGPLYYRKPGFTWDVESWLADHDGGGRMDQVLKAREEIPAFPAPVAASDRSPSLKLDAPVGTFRRYLATVLNARISSQYGYTIMPDGTFLIQTAWHQSSFINHPAYFKRLQPRSIFMKGVWFNAILFHAGSYYHWICDVLPRFHQILEQLPAETRLIVPGSMADWQWESLRAIGIERSRCVGYDGARPWVLERLIYAPPVAMTGDHELSAMAWVRDSVLSHFKVPAGPDGGKNRLFVTRQASESRHLVNERELFPILERFQYRVVMADALSFAEQVKLFSTATHIAAPHGGGITNLVWTPRGCHLLELFNPKSIDRRCYWSLALTLGHAHKYLVGDAEGCDQANSPYRLDPAMFEQGLMANE
jgi:hypothetical protein